MPTWYATRALLLVLLTPTSLHGPRRAAGSSLCPPGYEELPGGTAHVACMLAQAKPASCQHTTFTLSAQDKAKILEEHNKARSDVHSQTFGQASDMLKLEWDDALQAAAQKYADMCGTSDTPQPEAQRHTGSFTDVGQNVFFEASAQDVPFNASALVAKWVAQKTAFDATIIASYKTSTGTTQYAQLIWAKTSKVGCGYRAFSLTSGDPVAAKPKKHLFVCNYAPGGAKTGQPVFVKGNSCSGCHGMTCDSHLCVKAAAPAKPAGTPDPATTGAAEASKKSSWVLPGIAIVVTIVVVVGVLAGVYVMCRSHGKAAHAAPTEPPPDEGAPAGEGAGEGGAGEAAAGSKEAIVNGEKKPGE